MSCLTLKRMLLETMNFTKILRREFSLSIFFRTQNQPKEKEQAFESTSSIQNILRVTRVCYKGSCCHNG